MKEPVDHILRPRLPWRTDECALTECGYDASKVKAITRGDYVTRLKEMGRQRAAMFTCITCSDTATRYADWVDDPRQAVAREIAWESRWTRDIKDREQRLKDELFVISELIEAHHEEFDAAITARHQRRDWLRKKAALSNRAIVRRKSDPTIL